MKLVGSILFTLLVSTALFGSSEGETLYTEANCHDCHGGDSEFDSMNKKVKNLHDLNGWVSTCATNLNTGWFPEDENKVVEYLNETHYKLK